MPDGRAADGPRQHGDGENKVEQQASKGWNIEAFEAMQAERRQRMEARDAAIVPLLQGEHNLTEVAKEAGIPVWHVQGALKRALENGDPRVRHRTIRTYRVITPQKRNMIINMVTAGQVSRAEIARRADVEQSTVDKVVSRARANGDRRIVAMDRAKAAAAAKAAPVAKPKAEAPKPEPATGVAEAMAAAERIMARRHMTAGEEARTRVLASLTSLPDYVQEAVERLKREREAAAGTAAPEVPVPMPLSAGPAAGQVVDGGRVEVRPIAPKAPDEGWTGLVGPEPPAAEVVSQAPALAGFKDIGDALLRLVKDMPGEIRGKAWDLIRWCHENHG